jgi:parallel beta-helix repeat protein
VIRDTKPLINPVQIQGYATYFGRGIEFEQGGSLTIISSLIENNIEVGMGIIGVDLKLESSVIRNTSLTPSGNTGYGIIISASKKSEINKSIIIGNHSVGIGALDGTVLTVDTSVIKDTQFETIGIPAFDGKYYFGRGIEVSNKASATMTNCYVGNNKERGFVAFEAQITVADTTVAANGVNGGVIQNSPVSITSSAIRDTMPLEKGYHAPNFGNTGVDEIVFGIGIIIIGSPDSSIASSFIAGNTELGIIAENSVFTLESSIVRDTMPDKNNFGGAGVSVRLGSKGSVHDNLIEGNHAVGMIFLGAEGIAQNNVIRDTNMSVGYFVAGETVNKVDVGDGLIISSSNADVIGNTVTESKRYGVVFDNAKSTFANNTVMKNTYGLVTQNCADGSMVQENNTIKDNSVDFPSGMEVKYNNLYISTPGLSSSGK